MSDEHRTIEQHNEMCASLNEYTERPCDCGAEQRPSKERVCDHDGQWPWKHCINCQWREIERLTAERDIFRRAADRHLATSDRLRAALELARDRFATINADVAVAECNKALAGAADETTTGPGCANLNCSKPATHGLYCDTCAYDIACQDDGPAENGDGCR